MKNDISLILRDYGNDYVIVGKQGNSFSSDVYAIKDSCRTYILKIPYSRKAFDTEIKILNLLSNLSFNSPHIVKQSDVSNSFIMTQLEGKNGDGITIKEHHIKQIVELIVKFHNIAVPDGLIYYNYNLIVTTFYENLEKVSKYLDTKLKAFLINYCQKHFYILENRDFSHLIHRDVRLGNMIFSNETVSLIDFESCAIGDPEMDIIKIYAELKDINSYFGEMFIEKYAKYRKLEKKTLYTIIDLYIILDKINSLAWCYQRNKIGCDFYRNSLFYLINIYRKRRENE